MAIGRTKQRAARSSSDAFPLPPLLERSHEEAWRRFDARARELLGIGGEEFLRRLEQGDYQGQPEDERVLELGFMMVHPPR